MNECTQAETTFQVLETDERFKKLERTLKLAVLKNKLNLHNKNVDNKPISSGITWSNISSINGDTSNVSYLNSPSNFTSYTPSVNSEILTSSQNLRNILLKKKYQNNQKIMTTSSIRSYNVNQNEFDQFVMPPPVQTKIYHRDSKNQDQRIHMLSNNENVASKVVSTALDNSVQFSPSNLSTKSIPSCVSTNATNISKDYPQFCVASKISANDIQKVGRVFSRWKVMLNNQYEIIIKGTLECGKIAHSKPIVRRYTATCIESKFRHKYHLLGNIVDETNGLPDYVRDKFYNGFPDDWENVYLMWKTYINQGCPITFRWPTPITDSDDDLKSEMTDITYTCMSNDRAISKTKSYRSVTQSEHIQSECLNNKSPNKKKYNCFANNSQNYEKDVSFEKSISNSENNAASIAQTRNENLTYDDLKDYIHKDKLNIIINNLKDKNCSQAYIDKIVKMFDCLNYVASYRTPSTCNYDSVLLNHTSKPESISLQQTIMYNNNHIDTNNIKNRTTELKNYTHSTDPGYESIKNKCITTQIQSNSVSIESAHNDNKDSEKLESEIYAGISKIPIEQVLKHRERVHKRPTRKKIISQRYVMNQQHDTRRIGSESTQATIPITNAKQTFSEPCTSTLDEATNMRESFMHKALVHQRPHETTYSINPVVPRNNIHKIAKLPQQAHSQVVSDIDYATDSNIEMIAVDTNTQKASRSTKPDIYLDKDIVISNESNNEVLEKSHIPQRLHGEFFKQAENEIAMKRSKPIITSSIPVKLNLKISNMDSYAQSYDSGVIVKENKQDTNIRSTNEVHTKEPVLSMKSVIITNDSHSKMTANSKKEDCPNKKNSTKSMMNSADKQSNSDKLKNHPKVLTAWMPKVVHYAKSTYKLGLIFQGKLLNDSGHVTSRNHMTDVILKRLSETLIETVNHEYYELRGHLNDSKHNIPKKLAIQCRNGCPANIKKFCLIWESLQNDNLHDTSMDLLKVSVSSRGRKRVPPLCYWEGERINLKDDNPVYNLGSLQESSLTLMENSNEALAPEVKTASLTKKSNNSKKSVKNKQRSAQRLTYSSDSEKETEIRKRLRRSQPKVYVKYF